MATLNQRVSSLEEWREVDEPLIDDHSKDLQNHNARLLILDSRLNDVDRRLAALERSRMRIIPAFRELIIVLGSKGVINSREDADILGKLAPEEKPDLTPTVDLLTGRTIFGKDESAISEPTEPLFPYQADEPTAESFDPTSPQATQSNQAPVVDLTGEDTILVPSTAQASVPSLSIDEIQSYSHEDVSGWPEVTPLKVRFSTNEVHFDFAPSWDSKNGFYGNIWVIAQSDGEYHAGAVAFLREGETSKSRDVFVGPNIGTGALQFWRPITGVPYYFMITGLARGDTKNQEARTSIAAAVWP